MIGKDIGNVAWWTNTSANTAEWLKRTNSKFNDAGSELQWNRDVELYSKPRNSFAAKVADALVTGHGGRCSETCGHNFSVDIRYSSELGAVHKLLDRADENT